MRESPIADEQGVGRRREANRMGWRDVGRQARERVGDAIRKALKLPRCVEKKKLGVDGEGSDVAQVDGLGVAR